MNITAIKSGSINLGHSLPVPKVPKQLEPYLIKWASDVTCHQYADGLVLRQVYASRRFSANYYVFDLQSDTDFVFSSEENSITLHFMLQGDVACTWHGTNDVVAIPENTYRSFQVRAGEYTASLNGGLTQMLYFQFEPGFLSFIAEEFIELQRLIESLYSDQAFAALPARQIDLEVLNILKEYLVGSREVMNAQANLTLIINRLYHQYQLALHESHSVSFSAAFREQLVDNIKSDIKEGPHKEKHSYDYFARKYATSEATIRRAFAQAGECTMREFLHNQLMLKAQDLMAKGKRLEEVALLLGYSDKSSLSNAMKTDRKSQPN